MPSSLTIAEVARHNTEGDAYIVVDNKVYDVSKFAAVHPGGRKILLGVAGKDATRQFKQFHSSNSALNLLPKLFVADLASPVGDAIAATATTQSAATPKKNEWFTGDNEVFGDLAPFCEPAWYQDNYSPYYGKVHRYLRAQMREFVEKELLPYAEEWEANCEKTGEYVPRDVYRKMGKLGILRSSPGPVAWKKGNLVSKIPGAPPLPFGVKEGEFDFFCEQIISDELGRIAHPAAAAALTIGPAVATAPIIEFASEAVRNKVIPELLNGECSFSLAVTEPHAGSDVANLMTTAKLSDDGKHFIVNGEKKWITGGMMAKYFLAAVRTGGPGAAGISMLLLERGPGLTTRPVYTQTGPLAGTAYVILEDHKVPVGNLIGKLNEGFKTIMNNFNHERMGIVYGVLRQCRIVYADSLHYAHRRKTFGKLLIEHPVIRDKFAQMARQIEATAAWSDFITWQLQNMPEHLHGIRLGGHTALLKLQATRTFEFCAREACQVMGGIAYTKGGQGGRVERLYREVRGNAIPGGSEEIMADIGMRQSLKAATLMGAPL